MAYGDIQDAMVGKMGSKKKRSPPPPADGADDGVTVEVDDAEPDASDPNEGDEMSSYDDVEDSAAADMFDAVKGGDMEAFKTGLRDFVEACVKRQTEGK